MKTGNISRQELKEYAESIDGAILETRARHHRFLFHVDDKGFYYTPSSTMKQRVQDNKYIDLVLQGFNNRRSLIPSDYHDLTMNASYLLIVIEKYMNA